jgi:hypothetical protein
MPFGLTKAPASFQRMVNKVLAPFIDDFTLCYLDDIIIYSKSELEHIEHATKVLKVLEDNNLFVKLEKSEFHINKTIFLDMKLHLMESILTLKELKIFGTGLLLRKLKICKVF